MKLTWLYTQGKVIADAIEWRYSRMNRASPFYDGGAGLCGFSFNGTLIYPDEPVPNASGARCNCCGSSRFTNGLYCIVCYDEKVRTSSSGYMPLSLYGAQASVSHTGHVTESISRGVSQALASPERRNRLEQNKITGYHQTQTAIANAIVHYQEMSRGNNGLAGSGIYFAVNPEDTYRKATQSGTILQATVLLGNVKTIPPNGAVQSLSSLIAEGYDSVLIPRPGGKEYVVFHHDQVKNIQIYRQ